MPTEPTQHPDHENVFLQHWTREEQVDNALEDAIFRTNKGVADIVIADLNGDVGGAPNSGMRPRCTGPELAASKGRRPP